jgi:carbon-monoxide dehydrogenase medium subunit
VKPPRFEVVVATEVDEAVALLADGDGEVKVLAGGQSLVPLMSFRLARPDLLVDVNALTSLAELRVEGGELRIGAMARQRAVERSDDVRRACPLLAEVLPHVAHAPIRNRGTFGGSIAHADPSAELCAAVLVLDARIRARSTRGERDVPAAELFAAPFTTVLDDDELLTEVVIPAISAGTGWSFLEVARRQGDFALVGSAVTIMVDGSGTITDARLAYMSMGPTALRAHTAEMSLRGAPATAEAFARAADLAVEELTPSDDLHASADYRRHLARVLTRRNLERAATRAVAAA